MSESQKVFLITINFLSVFPTFRLLTLFIYFNNNITTAVITIFNNESGINAFHPKFIN